MTDETEDACPDCGNVAHNPKTGFCWLSTSRSVRAGFHCKHCCIRHGKKS